MKLNRTQIVIILVALGLLVYSYQNKLDNLKDSNLRRCVAIQNLYEGYIDPVTKEHEAIVQERFLDKEVTIDNFSNNDKLLKYKELLEENSYNKRKEVWLGFMSNYLLDSCESYLSENSRSGEAYKAYRKALSEYIKD